MEELTDHSKARVMCGMADMRMPRMQVDMDPDPGLDTVLCISFPECNMGRPE